MKLKKLKYPALSTLKKKGSNIPFMESPIAHLEINLVGRYPREKRIALYCGKDTFVQRDLFTLDEIGYEAAKYAFEKVTFDYIRDLTNQWIDF